jgi:hypothetical protein
MALPDLDELLRPKPASIAAVLSWLEEASFEPKTPQQDASDQVHDDERRMVHAQLQAIRKGIAANTVAGSARSGHHSTAIGDWVSQDTRTRE